MIVLIFKISTDVEGVDKGVLLKGTHGVIQHLA